MTVPTRQWKVLRVQPPRTTPGLVSGEVGDDGRRVVSFEGIRPGNQTGSGRTRSYTPRLSVGLYLRPSSRPGVRSELSWLTPLGRGGEGVGRKPVPAVVRGWYRSPRGVLSPGSNSPLPGDSLPVQEQRSPGPRAGKRTRVPVSSLLRSRDIPELDSECLLRRGLVTTDPPVPRRGRPRQLGSGRRLSDSRTFRRFPSALSSSLRCL